MHNINENDFYEDDSPNQLYSHPYPRHLAFPPIYTHTHTHDLDSKGDTNFLIKIIKVKKKKKEKPHC